ncbi:MAG: peroxiredoxin [Kiritimatiellae bacterium]|nr:peroxiredoxin [Kiritimatiellia bacterium]MDW8458614.1 peroxiredoxin [Verrucomicrobiota bacterium]
MIRRVLTVFLAVVWTAVSAFAVEEGAPAPPFRAASTAGGPLSLGDFSGSWLVLFFYPKSFTPGCTAQSCSLRDGYAAIAEQGAKILGVSTDSLETQQRFKAEHRLPFDLLADPDGQVARAYGVSGLFGKFARRVTFIISPDGRVARVIEDVQTGSHDRQVLDALRLAQQTFQASTPAQ